MEGTSGDEIFVTQDAAALYAGVSVSTLQRFVEAGYLRTERSDQGEALFSADEVYKVFGKDSSRSITRTKADKNSSPLKDSIEVEPFETSAEEDHATEPEQSHNIHEATPSIVEPYESEITRLKSSITLLERILEMKESSLGDLKEQCQWLKDRVERQEEQTTRDRAIIFATTQTMQRVIETNQKKPVMQSVLEFFGFVPINTLPAQQAQNQATAAESAFSNKK
jgi:hypothetical protein